MKETNPVGANRAFKMLMGEDEAGRWSRPVLRFWGFLFVGFVFLFVWLPSRETPAESRVLLWIITYTVYLLILEILGRKAKRWYRSAPFRLFRIHFNLAMIATLMLVAPPTASGCLWFFFSLPILAVLLYFCRLVPLVVIYLEVCAAMLILTFAQGGPGPMDLATMLAKDAVLGLLAAVLYVSFGNLAAVAINAASSYEQAKVRAQAIRQLGEVGQSLTTLQESPEVLQEALGRIANTAMEVLGADTVDLYQYRADRDDFVLPPIRVGERWSPDLVPSHILPDDVVVKIAHTGEKIYASDAQEHPVLAGDWELPREERPRERFVVREGIISSAGVPMKAGEEVLGVMFANYRQRRDFDTDVELRERIEVLANQGAIAINNARLIQRLSDRTAEVGLLQRVSAQISTTLKLDEILPLLVEGAMRLTKTKSGVVHVFDMSGEKVIDSYGYPRESKHPSPHISISEEGYTRLIIQRKEQQIVRDAQIDERANPEIKKKGIRSFVGTPLKLEDERVVGVLYVNDTSVRQFTEGELSLLRTLADQAAIAIQNVRFFEKTTKQIKELSTLHEVDKEIISELDLDSMLQSIAEKVRDLTGSERSLVLLVHEHTGKVTAKGCGYPEEHLEGFTLQEMRDGVSGWVLENKEPALIPDVQKDSRCTGLAEKKAKQFESKSLVIAPLLILDQDDPLSKKVIGTLTAVNTKEAPLFIQDDLDVVIRLADLATIAVQNARSLEETTKRAEDIAFTNEVGRLLSATRDIKEIPRLLVKETLKALDAETGSLALINAETKEIEFQFALDYKGAEKFEIMKGYKMPLDKGIAGAVVQSGVPVISNNVQEDPRWHREVDSVTGFTTKAILAVPLTYSNQVIGVIEILNKRDGSPFLEREKDCLTSLALSAAIAIRNAQLYEQRTQDILALAEINDAILVKDLDEITHLIADRAAQSIGADYCALRLVDSSGKYLILKASSGREGRRDPLPIDDKSFTGWIASQRKAELCSDVSQDEHYLKWYDDVKSCMAACLLHKGQLIGTLYVESTRLNAFSETSQLALLQSLADQAAIAIENARLFETMRRLNAQLEELHQVVQEQSLEEALARTLEGINAILGEGTSSSINLYEKKTDSFYQYRADGPLKDYLLQVPPRPDGTGRHVLRTGEPLYLDDVYNPPPGCATIRDESIAQGVKSFAALPLKRQEQIIGMLFVNVQRHISFTDDLRRVLQLFASQGAVAIENAQLFQELDDRAKRLVRLQEVTATISAEPSDLEKLLDSIVSSLRDIFSGAFCAIRLYDSRKDEFGHRVAVGPVQDLVDHPLRSKGTSRYVVRTQEPLYIEDVSVTPPDGVPMLRQEVLALGIKAAAYLPLLSERGVIGILYMDLTEPRQFSQYDKQILELFATQAAIAVENTQLYTELQQAEERLRQMYEQRGKDIAALREINEAVISKELDEILKLVVDKAVEVMPGEYCSLWLKEPITGDPVLQVVHMPEGATIREVGRLRAGQDSISKRVVETGKPNICEDVERDSGFYRIYQAAKSSVTVPLVYRDEVIGVLNVESPRLGAFTREHSQLLDSFADQAAIAIEQVQLFQELDERATQLVRLQEVTATISAEPPDIGKVSRLVVDGLGDIFPGSSCTIRLYDSKTDEFRPEIATGVLEDLAARSPRPEGTSRYVVKTKTPRYLEGDELASPPDGGPAVREDVLEQGVKSAAYLPLISEGDVIGVLYLDLTDPHRFSENEKRILELFANQAAITIENARLYEETDRLRAFNENIVQSMEEGVLLEDATGHITFINPKTAELLGYAREELIGCHYTAIIAPEAMAKAEEETTKRPQGIASRYETVLLTKEGQRLPAIVGATPIFDEGSFAGVLVVYTDITDRKRQETRLRDCLSTITSSLAQHSSLEGLYEFIVEAGAGFLSARDCALFLVGGENGDELKLVAAVASPLGGDGSSAIGTAINTGPPGGLVGYVAETCQPIRLLGEQICQHPSWSKELWTKLRWDFEPGANHSLLAAPMCLPDGRLAGILVARDAASREGFSEFDELLLETLATNAAADIEWVRSVEKAREDAVRDERARLETDLHEAMNVLATGVRWESEILSDQLSRDDPEARHTTLKRLQAALARAYADLRYLLEDLRDPTLEQEGLLVALRKRAEIIGGGCISMHGELDERLPPEIEGILYRVGQEAMSNAVKHSGVAHNPDVEIELHLECSEKQVKLWVKDNGKGFDVESTLGLSHKWGLRRLRDTLREMGGNLDVDSAAGQGATICATIGLMRRSDAQ